MGEERMLEESPIMEKQLIQETELEEVYMPRFKQKKILRVYVDEDKNIKFIDNSAAYALSLISYEQWCADEKGYYVISDEYLKRLEESGYIEIEYVFLERKNKFHIDFELNILDEENKRKFQNVKDSLEKEYINNNQYNDIKKIESESYNNFKK